MYRKLFECRIYHQFYLSGKDGRSVLDTSDIVNGQQERSNILQDKFNARIPSISDELSFSFAEAFKEEYRKYQLRLLPSYSGFFVLAPVRAFVQTDGTTWYKAVRSIPAGLPIMVEISRRSPFIDAITNGRLSNNIPADYFFTNLDPGGNKQYPVLSEIISPRDPNHQYEQGELYSSGNAVFAIFYDSEGNENQFPVAGTAFVNENDRITVAPRFTYKFRDSDKILDYSFVLKSPSGQTLQTISRVANSPVKNVSLDFSQVISPLIANNLAPHQLEVRGTDNYQKTHTLNFINSTDSAGSIWGRISIHPQGGPTALQLFDSSGYLAFKTDAGGAGQFLPVFEIWLKSRLSFWRYKNNKGKRIKPRAELDSFFDYDTDKGEFVSKNLRNASYVPTEFKNAGPGFRFFPNPVSYNSVARETKRLYTDILVPHSTIFESE